MNYGMDFQIQHFTFTDKLNEDLHSFYYARELWPIVYILSNGDILEAYVGETTDAFARMNAHLGSTSKNKLTSVLFISSDKFNKSATLDIESNLIKYISGDGKYKLLNANLGLANHNYFQKNEVYWDLFKSIWNRLRAEGISSHRIEYIDNSDLFKYSPYKSLTKDQKLSLLEIMQNLLSDSQNINIIEGGAGTGKTILAIFLFKLLHSDIDSFNYRELGENAGFLETVVALKKRYPKPSMALVVPMSSFRNTLKKVFKNIKGLNANMVIGPADIVKRKYDIVMVDESHRLRRRVNLGSYFRAFDEACAKLQLDKASCSELDWVIKQSDKLILFYDENQSIKPSDVVQSDFLRLKIHSLVNVTCLKSQFRVKGGNDYVRHVNKLLDGTFNTGDRIFNSKDYEFKLYGSLAEMVNEIKFKDEGYGLSRMIAGYSWEWVSKNNKKLFDIKIGDIALQWNSVSTDWINSPNAINEVGCIHTTQGYDLNYAGIIFGNEISFDKEKKVIVIRKENYFDRNGKLSIADPSELKNFIVNIYKTILLRGIRGTFIYACDPDLQAYFAQFIPLASTTTFNKLIIPEKKTEKLNSVPFYDLKTPAGNLSESNMDGNVHWVAVPSHIKYSPDLFACRVIGDSMNKVIPNGAVCLFRRYSGGSRNGKIVLVRHINIQDSDFGSGYTVKEYRSEKSFNDNEWNHESITLCPLSENSSFTAIKIPPDELNELKVVGIFECVLNEN